MTSIIHDRFPGKRRRGVAAAQVLVIIFVLLGCVALAVDVGFIYDSRGAMQSAVDASSLAGASALKKGHGAAKSRAVEFAAKNSIAKEPITSSELTITIGNWDGLAAKFYPANETDPVTPNAIRVAGLRTGVPLFFAPILGTKTTTLDKFATAVQGGGHCLGIWGIEGVSAEGDLITNSYDYRMGAYGGSNIHPNGDVCSCSDITLDGGVSINGDVIYEQNSALTISGQSYSITGIVDDQECDLTPPEFDMIEASISNDNATIPLTRKGRDPFDGSPWNLYVTGDDSLTLPPGKFYFDSVMIDGQATVSISGPTEIYVSGNGTFTGGGLINPTGDPTNLKIYMTGANATFTGSSTFYGGIIAPQTDVVVTGGGTQYGVVVAKTLKFKGESTFHVEESLVADLFGVEAVAPTLVE